MTAPRTTAQTFDERLRARGAGFRTTTGRAWTAIVRVIGPDELVLATALALIAAGCWMVWKPGALLVPGLVLLWLVLPARAPFLLPRSAPPTPDDSRRKR